LATDPASSHVGGYLPHVDGLRSVAVLGVLFAHFGLKGFDGGYLGVDVFFVISGFLITRLIINGRQRGDFKLSRFYIRRIRRLAPAALATVAASLLLLLPVLEPKDTGGFLASVPYAIFSCSNFHFMRDVGYFDLGALNKPLLHTWSLSVEEQFYIFWPATLLVMLRYFRRHVIPLCIALALVSVGAAEYFVRSQAAVVYYLLPFRAFELLLGAVGAMLPLREAGNPRWSHLAAGSGLLAIVGSFLLFDETTPTPGLLTIVPCVGTLFVILWGRTSVTHTLLANRPAVALGRISYSLYLVHWPVLVYVNYRLPEISSIVVQLGLIVICIALATVSYLFVEKPYRQPGFERGQRDGSFMAACAATAAVLSLLCWIGARPDLSRRLGLQLAQARTVDTSEALPARIRVPYPGSPEQRTMVRYVAKGERAKVLVLGDSHAQHLEPGLVQVFTRAGISLDFATLEGCPPLFHVYKVYGSADRLDAQKSCFALGEAKRALALSEAYDVVLLASRWFRSFEPTRYGSIVFRREHLAEYGDPAPKLEPNRSKQVFERHLASTVEELVAAGKRVIVFSQVSPLGNDITRCSQLFPWLSEEARTSGRCAHLTSSEQLARAKYTNTQIRELAKRHPDVLAVIPTEYMCPGGTCQLSSDDGRSLYADDNHLSTVGSTQLISKAEARQHITAFVLEARLRRLEAQRH